ncbi:MAG: glycosyltransferase [Solirubrobacterales bacterium]|nr:glycosyltransferase [Solirubrobacterales bacterium]
MSSTRSVSVIVPVKDGERYLAELLAAVFAQAEAAASLDVLVIDSGSSDRSVVIARAAGATVLEIEPSEFGHGRTRNLGAERTPGEIIVFLTQDATPAQGWLAGLLTGFDLAGDVGAVYGPHLARPDTSPMIARELAEFFATHEGPNGSTAVHGRGDNPFLSNVNAAYLRSCWEALRFPEIAYSEDQAFARALVEAGWKKAYAPQAAVLHAHDYPPVQFMQRYFDEYRGLRTTLGHIEPIGVRSTYRDVRSLVSADRAWLTANGVDARGWTRRSLTHHTGRKVFSALGSRAERIPPVLQRRISLEGTVTERAAPTEIDAPPAGKPIPAARRPPAWDAVRRYSKEGPAPLLPVLPGQDTDAPLHIACVIPPFSRGSGGHNSIFQIMWRLELAGHTVSYWIHDPFGELDGDRPARIRRDIREWFAPIAGPVFKGFDDWFGADVIVATGWQTAHPVMLLPACRARAYLVHDHEPEFYATSVESMFAEQTYSLDMHAICASPWLEEIMRTKYGRTTSVFDFGVDHDVYRPRPIPREPETIALYGRAGTPRRAVPLALMALQELKERRPNLRVLSFGSDIEIDMPVTHEHLGVLSHEQLSWVFSQSTVGLVLSLTNYSLIPQEMLACGLPCADLASISAESVFGPDGPVKLSAPDPVGLANALDALMSDEIEWRSRADAGTAFVADRTWDQAAQQVAAGIRRTIKLASKARR